MIIKRVLVFLCILVPVSAFSQLARISNEDTLCGHRVERNSESVILGWYKPEVPGAVYDRVVHLAAEFMKNTPVETSTGLPMYLVTCCFQGPHMNSQKNIVAEHWAHNPACVYAGSVQSLAVHYRNYTGDNSYLSLVKGMLDYQLENGTTPEGWKWSRVPYASADPFSKVYLGAQEWEADNYRADGLHVIEPDKVGELGYAYLIFFEITGENRYLEAAIHCADALAKNIIILPEDSSTFTPFTRIQSPWPFRVNARHGVIVSEYCSNVLEPVKLLRELLRIKDKIGLNEDQARAFKFASDYAWQWLFSKQGPVTTFIWNGYFEDVPNDPGMANRLQITPIELVKYLITHPEYDKYLDSHIPSLIRWVANAFRTEGLDAIKEQTWCYEPMGSHTARYGSACAMYYEITRDPWYKDQAFRFLNVASYMTYDNGVVAVGPNWPGSWFSDGYSDYIRHFFDAMAANPEWAPSGEDHLLRSSSVVKSISYGDGEIQLTTFDDHGEILLRLVKKPSFVALNGEKTSQGKQTPGNQWTWSPLEKGGILKIIYTGANQITIL